MVNINIKETGSSSGLYFPPFFSVIIATYNRADLIARALDSLVSQSEKDWEAIIVDDESTDETHSRVLRYTGVYPNIRYIRQNHKGEPLSKNTGIWSARGRYVTFLDSDDEYKPSHLKYRKALLKQNPDVKFLYGGVKIIGNPYVPDRFNFGLKVNLNDCIIGGTFIIDRETAILLDGFKDILLGADADLFDMAKNAGISMMEVHRSTYVYHHETEDSITNKLLSGL
jgi:glycosyltransferase involved in cell wall biosynthesis